MLTTSRFYLRKLLQEDANVQYLSWLNTETSRKFISYSNNETTLFDLKNYIIEKNQLNDVLFLGIFDKKNDIHIGNIKFEPIDTLNKYAIMGVLIGNNEYKGIGVVPEILDETTLYLNREFGIESILLGVSQLNVAAIKAYTKSGFNVIDGSPFILTKSKNSIIMEKLFQ